MPTCEDGGEQDITAQGPPRKAGETGLPAGTLRALILALLWRGSLAQDFGYSLTVSESVSVQEGLCIRITCSFKYPAWYNINYPSDQLHGHWYKDPARVGEDPPVASSDPSQVVSQETRARFQLVGNLIRGDCSLQINDARQTDRGTYFLRVEKGGFKYSYRSKGYPETCISVPSLTEKPEIQISPATLMAGELVTVTCTAPGRCSGTPPQITWTGPFSNTARDNSAWLANGTRAHSSVLSFTPTPRDDGKELVCIVTYTTGTSTYHAFQLHVTYPPGPPNITWTQIRNKQPVPGLTIWGADSDGSVDTEEGDSLTLICEAASRPVATLSWAKDNKTLSPSQGGVGCLELSNLSRGDAGEYRCWARNPYGSASWALRVHVQYMNLQITISRANRSNSQLFQDLPALLENGSQFTAREGDFLQFVCSISSRPPATLHWVWESRDIKNTSSVGENQQQLELHNVTVEDGGLYRCKAQSEKRSAQGMFRLLVEYSPRPGTRTNSSCQRQGSHISCICSVRSHPLPRLQWQVDGKALSGNSSWGALQVSSWAQGDEATSTLSWTVSRDGGPRIFCFGFNPIGTYAALHFDLSPPQKGAEDSARLLGLGVVCGLGVAVGCFLLGLCVMKLWSWKPAPPSTETRQPANGSQLGHTASDENLVYSNISTLPKDEMTLAAHQDKGIQAGRTAAKEMEELEYASIDFSKMKHKREQPLDEPSTDYSEIQLK